MLNIILALLFQCIGIADMRQMLLATHVIILLMVAITFGMTVYEVKMFGWSGKVKRNVICLCACLLGVVLDMTMYYVFNGQTTNVLGM